MGSLKNKKIHYCRRNKVHKSSRKQIHQRKIAVLRRWRNDSSAVDNSGGNFENEQDEAEIFSDIPIEPMSSANTPDVGPGDELNAISDGEDNYQTDLYVDPMPSTSNAPVVDKNVSTKGKKADKSVSTIKMRRALYHDSKMLYFKFEVIMTILCP